MAIYFFTKPFNLEEVAKTVRNMGFVQDRMSAREYSKDNGAVLVSLGSNSRRGKIQIQGPGITDVQADGRNAPYYSLLEDLAGKFKPIAIVGDSEGDNIFPELVGRG